MGDTGRRTTAYDHTPSVRQEPPPMPRLAFYALAVCVLSAVAAVVSFVQGNWLGIVWVLLAGVSSNMTWYYVRRGRSGGRSVTG
ncbi:hypothetical protein RM764_00590 [Streptomyces sp. DSM 41699]|uniref:Secreted protein n=2 Tax=Streptomyces gibsoniae TaxID=3075529 RepID=A0ABU2TKP7_9ACTN|nr:hypothetical protein [Streptomyces sp. DSM 41699]MDT0461507.1 hypothetical protein [Streptomyces sp. DSM 41699]